jgi:hopene-associated glycosyltransferase HpnB
MAALGALSLAIWLYLLLGRSSFWRLHESSATPLNDAGPIRRIAVIIPARNEADVIGEAIASLLRQDYPGPFRIFACDDHSSDDTAGVVQRCAASDRLTVVPVSKLPPAWTGKLWAISEGLKAAASFHADYYLLTDADIVHAPDNLSTLVARAEAGTLDLVSYMVKLRCRSFAERALIPAFVFFFFMLYPPRWTGLREKNTAGAAGGCILVRTSALHRIGGIAAIRGELIDDCALSAKVKHSGGNIWLGPTSRSASIRDYTSLAEVGAMISRTAFTQLRHSPLLLAGTVAGLAITYLAPPLLLISGNSLAAALGLAAWLLMSFAFLPTIRFYGLSPLWAPLLPAIALFYMGATIQSAIQYWSGRGGLWKGRVQDR